MKREVYRLVLVVGLTVAAFVRPVAAVSPPYCQILDGDPDPLYRVSLAVLPRERLDGYGRTSVVELNADWKAAYFHDILWGDIDLSPRFRSSVLMDSGGIRLRHQLVELSLDAGWTLRTMHGTAVAVGARPGMYSDLETIGTDTLYVPFTLEIVQSFLDQLSGAAGFELRPGFDREFIPRARLAWQPPGEVIRVEAGIPESRVDWFLDSLWRVHAGYEWSNTSYALHDRGNVDRRRITLEDHRLYAGFSRTVTGTIRFACDIGTVFDRSIRFKREAAGLPSDVDVGNGLFARIAVVGPL